LHLLGYDHETDAQAQKMESIEAKILDSGGVPNPYEDD
jgi:probable rRNA maturation factor